MSNNLQQLTTTPVLGPDGKSISWQWAQYLNSLSSSGGTSAGVESLNALSGALNITGTNISVAAAGTTVQLTADQAATPPGGSPTQLEFNNSGAFGGVNGSAVDAISGKITLVPTADTALLVTPASGQLGISVIANTAVADSALGCEVHAPTGGNATASYYFLTDNVGSATNSAVAAFFDGQLDGSNTAGDSIETLVVGADVLSTVGSPDHVYCIKANETVCLVAPREVAGLKIENQLTSGLPATSTHAGILIADQTPTATGFAIKTGLGPVFFGDGLTADASATSNPHALTSTTSISLDAPSVTSNTKPVAVGPGSSTAGHLATFAGTDGYTLADGGPVPAGTLNAQEFTPDSITTAFSFSPAISGTSQLFWNGLRQDFSKYTATGTTLTTTGFTAATGDSLALYWQ